jgi:uncharacterized phage-associated protein
MHDPRVVANYMIDVSKRQGIELTNLSLQKLLFFAHSISLSENKKALVSGYFEAWKYGPVHPAVYQAFKAYGSDVITNHAVRFDPVRRQESKLDNLDDYDAIGICDRVLSSFGKLSPGILVDLTHAEGGAWYHVVKESETGANIGLRIPNEIITEKQSRLKVSVTPVPRSGEPNEDSPIA